MKEYQYSIIRRESRNPKRNREGRGISQSDLEALKQELEGNSRGIVSAIYDRDIALDSLATTSTDISERLKTAEEGLRGKLDSGDFSKWKAGELAKALASKQPKGSYVDPSQLATSQQQAIAEAVKQAGEMDKQIKVGGRNLIRVGFGKAFRLSGDFRDAREWDATAKKLTVTKAEIWNSWVFLEWLASHITIDISKDFGLFTISFSVRGRGRFSFGMTPDMPNYDNADIRHVEMTEEWQRVSLTFDNQNKGLALFSVNPVNKEYIVGDWVQFADDWKLERGSISTDWTPAPEDVDDSIGKLTSQLESHSKTLGSQAEALDLVAGSVERLSEQYSIEAHTIGSPILKSDTDKYVIQCRIIHTPTGKDYTDQLLLSARFITPEWYRINPEGHDRIGLSDEEWANKHRGDAEVTITRKDFVTSCTVGYKIPRDQIINAIKSLTH